MIVDVNQELVHIESSLTSSVGSFIKELKEKHLDDPAEYPLDDAAFINDLFTIHLMGNDF